MESREKIWREHYQHPTPWEQTFPPMSMGDMVTQSATAHPQAHMIDFMGRKFSYGAMMDDIAVHMPEVVRVLDEVPPDSLAILRSNEALATHARTHVLVISIFADDDAIIGALHAGARP